MRRLVGLLLLTGLSGMSALAQENCPPFVQEAISQIGTSCVQTLRNQACYGNGQIGVEPQPNVRLEPFDIAGDIVALNAIKALTLSPLDTATQAWGLSWLQVQANLPDTLPGQNVTMIVSGGTSLENTGEALEAFYFSGGIGNGGCNSAPNGIMIQTPEGAGQIEFNMNGISMSVGSTLFVNALTPEMLTDELDIATLDEATPADVLDVAREAMTEDTSLFAFTLLEGSVTVASEELENTLTRLSTFVVELKGDEGMFKPIATYTLPLEVLQERYGLLLDELPQAVDLLAESTAVTGGAGACENPLSGTWKLELVGSDISQCEMLGEFIVGTMSSVPATYVEFPSEVSADTLLALYPDASSRDILNQSTTRTDACTFNFAGSPNVGTNLDVIYQLQTSDLILLNYNLSVTTPEFSCVAILDFQIVRISD